MPIRPRQQRSAPGESPTLWEFIDRHAPNGMGEIFLPSGGAENVAGKSLEQRVAETEDRIRQLQARKQAIDHQLRQRERKDRTRRLIQVGAILAKLGVDSLEKAQALKREVECRQQVKEWLVRVTSRATRTDQDADQGTSEEGAQE